MASKVPYDIIAVGGGLGGAAFAKAMADNGARVLVLERETQFKDRVRGEAIFPWGIAVLRELGIDDAVTSAFALEAPWFDMYLDGTLSDHRDLKSTTIQQLPALNWVHCEMEEALLQTAEKAGAEVQRGSRVCGVEPGRIPTVIVSRAGCVDELQARMIVCADGRASVARKWAAFETVEESYGMLISGVLLDAMPSLPADTNHLIMTPDSGHFVFVAPQRDGRARAYAWHPRERGDRLQGPGDLPRFVEESVKAGAPREWYSGASAIGPLATFDGTDNWVNHPYKAGVALIGDAAASSDPSYGQGQGLSVKDARVLRDQLLSNDDWDIAGHAYASEHDRYFGALHTFTGWFCRLFYSAGADAEALRARVLPLLAEDGTRMPDVFMSGPDLPLDETVRRRFFGEE